MSIKKFFENKRVLVTGGTGLIGRPLVKKLLEYKAMVNVVSLDEPIDFPSNCIFTKIDLRSFENCLKVTKDIDIVFHLAGVKGSPLMTKKQPASFFVPTLLFNTNMIEASRINKVKNFLYTSSIGVYAPADIFEEDKVWSTFPSENDKFAGWAKRMGELQIESYQKEYKIFNYNIVRPANVFGKFDNFDPSTAMVIPSLIHRVISGENPLKVWGDGEQTRDFIYADDVADGMLQVMVKKFSKPVNLGSGKGIKIKTIVEILKSINKTLKVEWDKSKPTGDRVRIMDTTTAKNLGIVNKHRIEESISHTYEWYKSNYNKKFSKYNSFHEK